VQTTVVNVQTTVVNVQTTVVNVQTTVVSGRCRNLSVNTISRSFVAQAAA